MTTSALADTATLLTERRRIAIPDLERAPVVPTGRVHRLAGLTMGTTWAVSVAMESPAVLDGIRSEVEAVLDTIVIQMSTWREDSDLSRFNAAPAGSVHTIREPFWTVLTQALDVARETGGAYDPTVGPLVDLWGFGRLGQRMTPPDREAIDTLRARVGWSALVVDDAATSVTQPGGVAIDLSAIAKGYAVDAVAACLIACGVSSFLVDIGGELRGAGVKPDGQPWWVALERPIVGEGSSRIPEETLVALCDMAVATSGDYRRYFDHDGRRYAHTIDPRTGCPVAHDVASVTVVHHACVMADALSTALTVMGVDEGLPFCEACGIAALFTCRRIDGFDEHLTPAFSALLS